MINTEDVEAVLLSDGWHEVSRGDDGRLAFTVLDGECPFVSFASKGEHVVEPLSAVLATRCAGDHEYTTPHVTEGAP